MDSARLRRNPVQGAGTGDQSCLSDNPRLARQLSAAVGGAAIGRHALPRAIDDLWDADGAQAVDYSAGLTEICRRGDAALAVALHYPAPRTARAARGRRAAAVRSHAAAKLVLLIAPLFV